MKQIKTIFLYNESLTFVSAEVNEATALVENFDEMESHWGAFKQHYLV